MYRHTPTFPIPSTPPDAKPVQNHPRSPATVGNMILQGVEIRGDCHFFYSWLQILSSASENNQDVQTALAHFKTQSSKDVFDRNMAGTLLCWMFMSRNMRQQNFAQNCDSSELLLGMCRCQVTRKHHRVTPGYPSIHTLYNTYTGHWVYLKQFKPISNHPKTFFWCINLWCSTNDSRVSRQSDSHTWSLLYYQCD